jgi:hypothetical protein
MTTRLWPDKKSSLVSTQFAPEMQLATDRRGTCVAAFKAA